MKKAIFGFLYFKVLGWKAVVNVPDYDKYIVCAAPHTSNWDLFIGKLFYGAIGRDSGFLMKKDWFFWPLGPIFRWMGGIPVERKKRTSLVGQIIEIPKERKTFHLAITPEGTRNANPEWKRGFYYIAKVANIPILLAGIDFATKTITIGKEFHPTDDIEKDMREIKRYFKECKGKIPENFSIGDID